MNIFSITKVKYIVIIKSILLLLLFALLYILSNAYRIWFV